MNEMASSRQSNPPCAACKFLRRKCLSGCIFAPYFPPEEPQKFANVHKVFGASNVTKILNEIQPHQREDAVSSLAYEAESRLRDPVYGCVSAISILQRQVLRLHNELEATYDVLLRHRGVNVSARRSYNQDSVRGGSEIVDSPSGPGNNQGAGYDGDKDDYI